MRYHEFPEDAEGWAHEFEPQTAPSTVGLESLRQALQRWPSDVRVLEHCLNMAVYPPPAVNRAEAGKLFSEVEREVERLPSLTEVNALFGDFEQTAGFERASGVAALRLLAKQLDLYLKLADFSQSDVIPAPRRRKVRERLAEKGWVISPSPAKAAGAK